MKKVFTLILALAFGFSLKAQTDLTQAVDFTATDIHGTEVHLFDILDSGQAVVIDFFYTTCSYCIQSIPYMVQSYQALGCNMHDVFYVEVDYGDSDQACLNWVNNHNVEYPTISGVGGGTSICSQYHIDYFPTVILIMPNRQIVIQDLYPIPNAQTVINQLEAHGIQQHDCNTPSYDPQIALSIDEVTATSITATFTPNEDCATYYYLTGIESEIQEQLFDLGLELPEYLSTYGSLGDSFMSQLFIELIPGVEYTVYALPADPDGNLGEVVSETVTTLLPFDETLTFSMDTVNLEWGEMSWITVYNNTYDNVTVTGGCDELGMLAFKIGGEIFTCQTPPFEFEVLQGESFQLGVICSDVIGKSLVPDVVTISSNRPDAHFVVMVDDIGMVRVFNVLGQMVDAFETNGSDLRINTAGYENGVYVVKTDEKTLRFVVKH